MDGPGAVNPHAADGARRFHRATGLVGEAAGSAAAGAAPTRRAVALPPVAPAPGLTLEEAIAGRRTRRDFDRRAVLPLEQLARLLV